MKYKDGKTDIKVGDLVIGSTAEKDIVFGLIASIDETKKTVTVGPVQRLNASTVAEGKFALASSFLA